MSSSCQFRIAGRRDGKELRKGSRIESPLIYSPDVALIRSTKRPRINNSHSVVYIHHIPISIFCYMVLQSDFLRLLEACCVEGNCASPIALKTTATNGAS